MGKLIIIFLINGLALYAAGYFIPGFRVSLVPELFLETTILLALINLIIKPILKFFLMPVIWLTLGSGIFVLNAFILYLVSRLTGGITIESLKSLLLATFVVSLVNIICRRLLLRKS